MTAVRSQNNFWIIKPFYHLTILSFSFNFSSSILPPAGGRTLDHAPFTGLCLHLFIWPLYILFWCFSLKRAPDPTSCSIMIFTQYMFHRVLPSGVQSVYGVSWWQLPGTYYRQTWSQLRPVILQWSIRPRYFLWVGYQAWTPLQQNLVWDGQIFYLFVYLCCIFTDCWLAQ